MLDYQQLLNPMGYILLIGFVGLVAFATRRKLKTAAFFTGLVFAGALMEFGILINKLDLAIGFNLFFVVLAALISGLAINVEGYGVPHWKTKAAVCALALAGALTPTLVCLGYVLLS